MSVKPAHIIETPRWVAIVRVIQFVLAIVILGCAAYGIYWLSLGVSPPLCYRVLFLCQSLTDFI